MNGARRLTDREIHERIAADLDPKLEQLVKFEWSDCCTSGTVQGLLTGWGIYRDDDGDEQIRLWFGTRDPASVDIPMSDSHYVELA